jgi:hypothetical protein
MRFTNRDCVMYRFYESQVTSTNGGQHVVSLANHAGFDQFRTSHITRHSSPDMKFVSIFKLCAPLHSMLYSYIYD